MAGVAVFGSPSLGLPNALALALAPADAACPNPPKALGLPSAFVVSLFSSFDASAGLGALKRPAFGFSASAALGAPKAREPRPGLASGLGAGGLIKLFEAAAGCVFAAGLGASAFGANRDGYAGAPAPGVDELPAPTPEKSPTSFLSVLPAAADGAPKLPLPTARLGLALAALLPNKPGPGAELEAAGLGAPKAWPNPKPAALFGAPSLLPNKFAPAAGWPPSLGPNKLPPPAG